MRKRYLLLLILILIGAFWVRLYKFSNPIADWHSWRQADTSAVSRNFVTAGFDILHPRFDDLSNVASGMDNPQGYRFVEFPLYNVTQAGLYKMFDYLTIEQWGRLVTIFAQLTSIFFLYKLVTKHAESKIAGLLTAFFFAFIPYNIYYGRTILPDPSMVAASLGGVYFFDLWLEKGIKYKVLSIKYIGLFLLSVLFTASALLLKPYALFFTLPMIYLAWKAFGLRGIAKWQLWLFAVLVVIPLALWRMWIQQFPEGIPVSDWLYNANNIRFKGAFFQWLFADRIARLILGYWGIALLAFGFLAKTKNQGFFYSFLVSSLLYLTVFAGGNVQHDYYQILIMPTLTMFLGLGGSYLLEQSKHTFSVIRFGLLGVCTIFLLMFGWYGVRDYFNINNPSLAIAGEAVDRLTPKTAKILAIYDGDTSLLYQTKRKGWASFQKSLPEMIKLGADYLLFVNTKPTDKNVGDMYKIVSVTDDYILFNLRQKP